MKINLAGVEPYRYDQSSPAFSGPDGLYRTAITNAVEKKSKANNDQFEIHHSCMGPTHIGDPARSYLTDATNSSEAKRMSDKKLAAALDGIGIPAHVYQAPGFQVTAATFIGKTNVPVLVKQYPGEKDAQGRPRLPDISIISQAEAAEWERTHGTPAGQVPQPGQYAQPVPQQPVPQYAQPYPQQQQQQMQQPQPMQAMPQYPQQPQQYPQQAPQPGQLGFNSMSGPVPPMHLSK